MSRTEQAGAARWGFAVALAFSTFQIATAAYPILPSQIVRAVHVGFLILLIYLIHPGWLTRFRIAWVLGGLGFGLALYHWIEYDALILRAGDPSGLDLAVGVATLILLFDATRRMMGWGLPIIAAVFFTYALVGPWLPDAIAHRGYPLDQLIDHLAFGTEGIYGIPAYVSSTYIFLFILFGAFLEQAGMIKLFSDFAMGLVGHTRGGPAKIAVVSSALMGTINGSGVANVVTTGQFTIPLMKRFGYRAEFAGGVEATASMGGQIMPPVMGAVAFIMAETLNVPYVEIAKAALIPALLYFFSAFWMVHLEAGKHRLLGLDKADCPNPWAAVKARWHLILPLAALVWLLFAGYTPLFSGTVGLALTVILIFATPLARALPHTALRVVFWVALGLACAGFVRYGIAVFLAIIGSAVVLLWFVKGGRETLRLAVNGLAEGAKQALPVGIACALVGVVIGVITLTGVATTFAAHILKIGEHSLLASLALTMLTCLVLGMGIPTIPNYIITSSIAAPALLDLGVPLIVSHMFVFYFGIMADLTPPVALAAFAAAPIARASGMKIGVEAVRIALAGFVVPYMAVYAPALMLQGGGALATVYVVIKAVLAIMLWGAASIGFWLTGLSWAERLLCTAAAALLVFALPFTDEAGFALAAIAFTIQLRRSGSTWRAFALRSARSR